MSCNLSFKYRSDLLRHESVHKKKELKSTCNKRFACQDHFNKHVDICQNKQEQHFKCENCDKKSRVRTSLDKHKIVCLKLTERSPWFEDNFINFVEDVSSFNTFFQSPQKSTSVFPSMAVEENNFTHVTPTVESIMLDKSSDESDHQTPLQDQEVPEVPEQSKFFITPCQTPQQQQIQMRSSSTNHVKVHRVSQELSRLLHESPLDDDCKVSAITSAIKKLEMTSELKDRLRISSALRKKNSI